MSRCIKNLLTIDCVSGREPEAIVELMTDNSISVDGELICLEYSASDPLGY